MRAGVALFCLALGLGGAACGRRERAAAVPVYEVKRQPFARVIEADGLLKPVVATPVTVPPETEWSLRITWLAPDGAKVKKGDPVARFDDLDLKEKLANATADRSSALAKKEREELLQKLAQRDRLRVSEGAQRELELSRTFQRRDTEIFSRNEIVESEIDGQLHAARVDNAKQSQKVDSRLGRSQVALIGVEEQKAADAIARAQKGLRNLEIHAAHDGIFTVRRNGAGEPMRVGDTAYRTMIVAEVALVEKMEAEVFVLEAEAAGLSVGRKAEVYIEAQPGRPFAAVVKRVESVAKRRQPKSPTQYFGVTLSLSETVPELMKPGQRARARLHLSDAASPQLVVPRPSVFERDGGWVVHRRAPDGSFAAVVVKLGASSAGLVTIESGIQEGDVIALRDPGKAVDELVPGAAGPSQRAR